MNRHRSWLRAVRILGLMFLVIGAQWLVYEHRAGALEDRSRAQLASLRLEVGDNREANAGLRALQDAWTATSDAEQRRAFVALRDRVTERFLIDREAAIGDFINTVDSMSPVNGEQPFAMLRRQSARLAGIYSNRSADALAFVDTAPWYLQPGAHLPGDERRRRLQFNAAVHLLLMGDLEAALPELVGLREQDGSAGEIARIDYALARLHYARYTDEQAVDGLTQALSLVQESLRHTPDDELPLLLLDYLLAADRTVNLVDMETFDGQGSGQGDGERGALSSSSDKF